jgi:hypothetical protein
VKAIAPANAVVLTSVEAIAAMKCDINRRHGRLAVRSAATPPWWWCLSSGLDLGAGCPGPPPVGTEAPTKANSP